MLELLASEYRPFAQDILTVLICVAAFVWGAAPERAMAAVWLVCFEASSLIYGATVGLSYQLETTDAFLATVDVCAGVLWIMIALNANRNYPLFIAALQVLAISAHLVRGLIEAISPVAYAVMVIAPGWLQLMLLGLGVCRHIMRKRRYGPYRDWRVPIQWSGVLPEWNK